MKFKKNETQSEPKEKLIITKILTILLSVNSWGLVSSWNNYHILDTESHQISKHHLKFVKNTPLHRRFSLSDDIERIAEARHANNFS